MRPYSGGSVPHSCQCLHSKGCSVLLDCRPKGCSSELMHVELFKSTFQNQCLSRAGRKLTAYIACTVDAICHDPYSTREYIALMVEYSSMMSSIWSNMQVFLWQRSQDQINKLSLFRRGRLRALDSASNCACLMCLACMHEKPAENGLKIVDLHDGLPWAIWAHQGTWNVSTRREHDHDRCWEGWSSADEDKTFGLYRRVNAGASVPPSLKLITSLRPVRTTNASKQLRILPIHRRRLVARRNDST